MELLILSLFLALVSLVAVLLDRRWQRRAQAGATQAEQPSVLAAAQGASNTLVEQIKIGWQKRMGWRNPVAGEQAQLRAWLHTALADQPDAQEWMAGLNDPAFATLQQQMQAFCANQQIDLAWLGTPALAQDPALQATVQAVVLHYVQAQHQAANVQAELRAFKTWLALTERPYSHEYQPLVHQLYTRLVKAGLTEPARPEALLATEKLRVEHMLQAIQAAAEANRPAFYRMINALQQPQQPAEEAPLSSAKAMASSQSTPTN